MLYACILEHFIYTHPPLSIPVWTQAPGYVFGALSEIFVVVTGLEVAFIKSPENLRAFVSSIFWLTIAVGSALGIALAPVSTDPLMVWTYGALSVTAFLAGVVFWVWFRGDVVRDVGSEGSLQAGEESKPGVDCEKV